MPDYPAAMNPVSSKLASNVNAIAQASVASLANPITAFITTVSGAAAITGFRVPSGFRGIFVLIPTGTFTGATGGVYASDGVTDDVPIGSAFTAIVGKPVLMVCDGKLCYPLINA